MGLLEKKPEQIPCSSSDAKEHQKMKKGLKKEGVSIATSVHLSYFCIFFIKSFPSLSLSGVLFIYSLELFME